jgi:hypothetical protein
MSMQLYIIYNSITLDFQANGYKLMDGFYPETPDEGMESITDQFDILITGSSASDLRSKITAVRLAFEHASRHKEDALAAWLYYDVDSSGDAWMTKLLGGSVIYNDKLDRNWRQNKVVATIIVERKPYWDAKDELQVPLTNGNGTNDISGLTVYNHDDAGTSPAHDNWVEIAAADVLGDLPGPTRLEVLNTFNDVKKLGTLWIGQNWTDPANFSHILEAEDASGGSDIGSAACSGAYYSEYALGSGSEVDMFTWTLSDSFLDACQGQYYKFLARFFIGDPPNVKFRIKLKYNAVTVWQSGQVTLDQSRGLQIRDMFTLRLPPWLPGQTNLSALSMVLVGQQSTGSPINVDLDFLQVTPLDGWRMLECAGYGISYTERLIDDGVNGYIYVDNGAGDNKIGDFAGYGNPIALYPGKKQRLYFLMHTTSMDVAEILRTISVKLYYHPRRRTL